jgi:hypothetical protein
MPECSAGMIQRFYSGADGSLSLCILAGLVREGVTLLIPVFSPCAW